MSRIDLEGARFPDDRRLFEELTADAGIKRGLEMGMAARNRSDIRTRLLGSAVRIDPAVMPQLAAAFGHLSAEFPEVGALESYVFNDSDINAFVTEGRERTFVALSSAAVNALDSDELGFIIGHELGHAAFRHTSMNVNHLAESGGFTPPTRMRLRAWQRAAEISADRAGLLSCGSIDRAASALFKTVSGLSMGGLAISPERFAGQWSHLLDEVMDDGDRGHWQLTHPFPPLRMAAMLLYWRALREGTGTVEEADREISRMLAMMDPASAGDDVMGDPILGEFFFWGGLYIALTNGHPLEPEVDRLQAAAPFGTDLRQLIASDGFDAAACKARFIEEAGERRRKLSAVELHRIVYGLIDVAVADGEMDEGERARIHELGEVVGIAPRAADLVIAQYLKENRDVD